MATDIGLKEKFSLVNFIHKDTAAKKATKGRKRIVIFGTLDIIIYLDCSKALINSFSISDLIETEEVKSSALLMLNLFFSFL